MGKFVRDVVVTGEVSGQPFTATLEYMRRAVAMKFSALVGSEGGAATMNPANLAELEALARPCFKSLTGLAAEDGSAVTIEEFCTSFYFTESFVGVLSEWLTKSLPDPKA